MNQFNVKAMSYANLDWAGCGMKMLYRPHTHITYHNTHTHHAYYNVKRIFWLNFPRISFSVFERVSE